MSALDALLDRIVVQENALNAPERSLEWTDAELGILRRDCADLMTDMEIALHMAALGYDRSQMAVHLKRERLDIPVVTRTPGWASANQVKLRLGLKDARVVSGWVKAGFVYGRFVNSEIRPICMVHETSLRRFCIVPENWVRYDTTAIVDPHLKRLVALAQERWGDEWLNTRQAADLIGRDIRLINAQILRGKLPAIHLYNKDGRVSLNDEPAWSYNFVRRSLVEKLDIPRGRRHSIGKIKLTPGGTAWIRTCLANGWTASAIARSMKCNDQTVRNWIVKGYAE